jgi:hypothetical protein
VERDLADSAAEGLSADWRQNIAYNAALGAWSGRWRTADQNWPRPRVASAPRALHGRILT